MTKTTTAARRAAFEAHAAGLCVLPPNAGTHPKIDPKAPLEQWKELQSRRSTRAELERWYGNGRLQLGAVCGKVSGNLEVLDFDSRDAYTSFVATCRDLGLGELIDRIQAGYAEDSPNGVHWLYRCDTIQGSQKLARHADGTTKIETRGEGGYIVLAPTIGLHADNQGYSLRSGSFATIATITPEERAELHNVARLLDETPPRENLKDAFSQSQTRDGELRPGDDFNARASWAEAMPGWTHVGSCQNLALWRRPDKVRSWSATTGVRPGGLDLLHCFTSSTPLAPGQNYTKFSAYAWIAHNGDFKAAAKALGSLGYGQQSEQQNGKTNGYHQPHAEPKAKPESKPLPRSYKPSELYEEFPTLHTPIVDGLLRAREIMNIIAAPKARKSWLSLGLILSVATGRDWLGRFPCTKGRVLVCDNELHEATLSSRLRWVARSMGIDLADYDDQIEIVPFRGHLSDLASLRPFFEAKADQFALIVLDAGYRYATPGESENDNAAMTARYNLLDEYAAMTGAALTYIHHSAKGNQSDKATVDIGAGANAQARAADTHLVLIPDESLGPNRLVVDAAIRSFAPIEPFVIHYDHPIWSLDGETPAPVKSRREKVAMTPETFALSFADEKPRTKDDIRAKAEKAGMTARDARAALETAVSDGFLHPWKMPGEAHRRYATIPQPTTEDEDDTPPF